MIKRVIIINLPFREDRQWFMRGHLTTIGVPRSLIEFFPAKYGLDFENTAAVQAAAAADGFEFLNRSPSSNLSERSYRALIWNYCSVLRSIEKGSDFALVMLDDRLLKMDFERLCHCVKILNRDYPPFHALQLGWWLSIDSDIEVKPISGFLGWGVRSNGDYATVFSPDGARRMLKSIEEKPWFSIERMFFEWSRSADTTGLFHTLDSMVEPCSEPWGQNSIKRSAEDA